MTPQYQNSLTVKTPGEGEPLPNTETVIDSAQNSSPANQTETLEQTQNSQSTEVPASQPAAAEPVVEQTIETSSNAVNDSTLEDVTATTPGAAPKQTEPEVTKKSTRKWALRGLATGAVLLLLFLLFMFTKGPWASGKATKQVSVADKYATNQSALNDLAKAGGNNLATTTDASAKLTVNGALDINGSFVITSTGKPTNPIKGQLYFDQTDQKLYFYNGSIFIDVTYATTIATGTVTSLQGQVGAVSLNAGSGIGISGTTITNTDASIAKVLLQGSTPGTAQTGNINVTGSVLAGNFQGGTFQGSSLALTNSGGTGSINLKAANPGASNFTLTLPAETGTLCSTATICAGYAANTGASAAFVNGGNSFGATANLGTNDNNNLVLRTNGVDHVTLDTTGNVGISAASNGAKLYVPYQTGDVGGTATAGINTINTTFQAGDSTNVNNNQIAVDGETYSGVGVQGVANTGAGVIGVSNSGTGLNAGVMGVNLNSNGTGVLGMGGLFGSGNGVGVAGYSGTTYGVQGVSANGISGYFQSTCTGLFGCFGSSALPTLVTQQYSNSAADLLQAQDSAGASVFNVAYNGAIGVKEASGIYAVGVNGDVNLEAGNAYRIGGTAICTSGGCAAAAGSGSYIQNSASLQTGANFNMEVASINSIGGIIQGKAGQVSDLFQLRNSSSVPLVSVAANGDTTLTSNLTVGKQAAVGSVATVSAGVIANFSEIYTNTSGSLLGTDSSITLNPAAASSANSFGSYAASNSRSGNSQHLTGYNYGASGSFTHNGSGTVDYAFGNAGGVINASSGTLSVAYGASGLVQNSSNGGVSFVAAGVEGQVVNSGSGTVASAIGLFAPAAVNSGGGTITNNYGLSIQGQTVGANNYGAAIGAASTQTLWVSSDTDSTTAAAGIGFGSSRDTNLYRSAAGTLKTDGKLSVGTLGTTNTSAYLCLNGTNILASCSTTGSGAAFVQGGNSFGAIGTLGTNDANGLVLRTNSTTACTISGSDQSLSCPGAGASSERFGSGSAAAGVTSLAVGNGASAGLTSSTVLGQGASASGNCSQSVVIGQGASCTTSNGIAIGMGASVTANGDSIAIGRGATTGTSGELVIGGTSAISTAYIGNGAQNAAPAAIRLSATGGSGTNITGATLTLSAGNGTGSATGGAINFQTSAAGASGSAGRSRATVFSLAAGSGNALFQNTADSATAFQIQNLAGTSNVFNVDTSNTRVGIGNAAPTFRLMVDQGGAQTAASGLNVTSSTLTTNIYNGGSNTSFLSFSNGWQVGNESSVANNGTVIGGRALTLKTLNNSNLGSVVIDNNGTSVLTMQGSDSNFYVGNGVTNAAPTGRIIQGTGGSGTDISGASLTIAGGKSTGAGTGGSIVLQTTTDSFGSGSSLNTLTNRLTVIGETGSTSDFYFGNGITSATPYGTNLIATGSSASGTAGGNILMSGGAGNGSGNGGLATLRGGTAGSTGAGGGVTLTATNGGGTSGTGGVVNITSGSGTAGNSAGGAINLTSGNGVGSSSAAGLITLQGGTGSSTAGTGGGISLLGGTGGAVSGAGGTLTLTAGNAAAANSAGGAVNLTAGTSLGNQNGGAMTLTAGTSGVTGGLLTLQGGTGGTNGGGVSILAGSAASGTGGAITITASNGAGNTGGAVNITAGSVNSGNVAGGAVTITSGTAGAGANQSGGLLTLQAGAAGGGSAAGGGISILTGAGGATSGAGGTLTLTAANATAGGNGLSAGGPVNITAGNAVAANNVGGAITQTTGNGSGSSAGGLLTLQGGTGGATGAGGGITLTAGAGGATSGAGGALTLQAGSAAGATGSNAGGAASLKAGASAGTDVAGSTLTLAGGQGTGVGNGGSILLQYAAPAGSTGSGVNALATAVTVAGGTGDVTIANNDRSGSALTVTATAMTSGNGIIVNGPTSGSTLTGNLLNVNTASTGAATNGFIRYNFSGAHTGNGVQIDDLTTSGNTEVINSNSNTSGLALKVSATAETNVAQFLGSSSTQCTVVTGTGWSCSSDRVLKTNIASVTSATALSIVNQLNPVTFNWLTDPNGTKQDGFIAQDIQQILPELVTTDSNGHLSLNKDGILPYLAGAIQEQQKQINALQQTNGGNGIQQNSSATLASLNVSGATTLTNLTVTGSATVAQLTVTGSAQFAGNITVNGHIIGNADTRGKVTIPAGQDHLTYTFTKPYDAGTVPNIVLTAQNTFAPAYRVDATATDFTVYFQTPATADTTLNYQVQQ